MQNSFGMHYIVEFSQCNPEKLKHQDDVESGLLKAVQKSGATYINHYVHQFSPHGVSAVVLIAESHFSIHTWPESGYAGFDIFTCGKEMNPEIAIAVLKQHFEAKIEKIEVVERGFDQ